MAARCFPTTAAAVGTSTQGRQLPLPISHTQIITYSYFPSSASSRCNFRGVSRNPTPYRHSRRRRRMFAQLTPPQSDPPPDDEPLTLTGVVERISRFQDRVLIFSAVFLWMFAFFWFSAWDGRNKGGGGGGGVGRRSRLPPFGK
ncbi:hypothetical protein LINGRAHAP2_LOCUS12427 [Linum grandiflorum]